MQRTPSSTALPHGAGFPICGVMACGTPLFQEPLMRHTRGQRDIKKRERGGSRCLWGERGKAGKWQHLQHASLLYLLPHGSAATPSTTTAEWRRPEKRPIRELLSRSKTRSLSLSLLQCGPLASTTPSSSRSPVPPLQGTSAQARDRHAPGINERRWRHTLPFPALARQATLYLANKEGEREARKLPRLKERERHTHTHTTTDDAR